MSLPELGRDVVKERIYMGSMRFWMINYLVLYLVLFRGQK
jgi:hypothetical protein